MRTVPLAVGHAHDVASLHVRGINTGFISSLGIDFVSALYEAIAKSASSFGFAIEENNRVLGFVTFSTNLNKLYKSVILKKGWRFALLLAAKMFSLRRIKKVLETLFYPSRVKKMNLPSAELLSIAVDPAICHKGLGTVLVRQSLQRCRELGLDRVKVLVAADNEPANRLYTKCGFKLVGQIDNHGVPSNIYEAKVDATSTRETSLSEVATLSSVAKPTVKIDSAARRWPAPAFSLLLMTGFILAKMRRACNKTKP
jgi:ribosomal protein S18 acetylase RimI-like enzyme